jgi:hypothetical protein
MEAIDHNNEKLEISQNEFCLAEEIYHNLNQGSLFEIYRLMEQVEGKEKIGIIRQAFFEKYNFDFRKYI